MLTVFHAYYKDSWRNKILKGTTDTDAIITAIKASAKVIK